MKRTAIGFVASVFCVALQPVSAAWGDYHVSASLGDDVNTGSEHSDPT